MAIISIYIFWRERKAHAPLLSLLTWLSGFVLAAGNSLAIYDLWSLGEIIGWVGQILFLFFVILDSLRRNSQQKE